MTRSLLLAPLSLGAGATKLGLVESVGARPAVGYEERGEPSTPPLSGVVANSATFQGGGQIRQTSING